MLNEWVTKSIKTSKMPKKIYRLADSWRKQQPYTAGGSYAATYYGTIEEDTKIRAKKQGPKKLGKLKLAEAAKQPKNP